MYGLTFEKIFPKKEHEKHYIEMKDAAETEPARTFETTVLTRSKKEIPVQFSYSKMKDVKGIASFLGICSDITARKKAEKDLEQAHLELVESSRMAGMAEVASDVLHNVGNVLNSINVSTTVIREKVINSEITNLEKVASIINEYTDDLGTFFTEHPKGKHIPVYLSEVSKCMQDEQTDIMSRLQVLADNVQHIKDIINMQQSYSKVTGFEVQTSLSKLVEDAIQINSAGLERHEVQLIREFEELGDVEIDKQKILQILVNLISNAKYAVSGNDKEEKLLTIRIYKHGEDHLRIEVADKGVGILKDNLTKIFNHGFTTKKHGHGFGLHSGALAAKEMGGSLAVHSDGVGQGATFTLELPFKPVEVRE
jgi:C4-dicarboxylate-specific signal transduction histidine kinase